LEHKADARFLLINLSSGWSGIDFGAEQRKEEGPLKGRRGGRTGEKGGIGGIGPGGKTGSPEKNGVQEWSK